MQTDNGSKSGGVSRREFLEAGGAVAATSVIATLPAVARGQGAATGAGARRGIKRIPASGTEITLQLNGESTKLAVTPETTLLRAVRETLGHTGAKEVCDRGACGACTMIVDGRSVNSCMMLAVDAVGKKITSIEGLVKDGKLDPVQEAFIANDACQCGYCIPGMVVRSRALLDEHPHPTKQEIKTGMCGNICRCAAYVRIFAAIEAASKGGQA